MRSACAQSLAAFPLGMSFAETHLSTESMSSIQWPLECISDAIFADQRSKHVVKGEVRCGKYLENGQQGLALH